MTCFVCHPEETKSQKDPENRTGMSRFFSGGNNVSPLQNDNKTVSVILKKRSF